MKNESPFFKKKLKNFCLLKNFDLNWVTNRVNSQNQISNFLCRLNQKDFQLLHLFDRQIVWDGKPGWDGKQETSSIHRLFRYILLHHTIKKGIVHNFLYAPKKIHHKIQRLEAATCWCAEESLHRSWIRLSSIYCMPSPRPFTLRSSVRYFIDFLETKIRFYGIILL